MEIDIDPVYIKDDDINVRGNIIIKLCTIIHKQYPGEVYGAQHLYNSWLIYVRSPRTRASLIVSGLDIEGHHIPVHDDKPELNGDRRSERVVIKDLPATLSPDRILSFFKGYSHITTRSRVLYAKERLGGEEMSPFINGDRLLYIKPNVNPPLPLETVICGHTCRIWHPSQKNFCKRCATHGHRTIDTEMCESYDPDCVVAAWRADNNPLSNFFKCSISHNSLVFKSAEHFYQYELCMFMNRSDIAQQVFDASTPKTAKEIAAQLKTPGNTERLAEWANINLSVMAYIMKVKWNCCARFRQALQQTENMCIAEATSDTFWGVGVAPNLAQYTKPGKFLGQNNMGKIQMQLRHHVSQPGSLNNTGELVLPPQPVYDSDSAISHVLELATTNSVSDTVSETSSTNLHATSSAPPSPSQTPSILNIVNPMEGTSKDPTSNGQLIEEISFLPQGHDSAQPFITPRKQKKKTAKQLKANINTIDNFFIKDSPVKRKPSGEAGSPSSVPATKANRTDGADTVS